MADQDLVSIPADLAFEVLQALNALAVPPYRAPTAHAATALAHALAKYNPSSESAFGPMGEALFSANDPTAWESGAAESQRDL